MMLLVLGFVWIPKPMLVEWLVYWDCGMSLLYRVHRRMTGLSREALGAGKVSQSKPTLSMLVVVP